MSGSKSLRGEESRRRAEEKFALARQRESEIERERAKAEAALNEKTARLRALRLAKEAADKAAAGATLAAKRPGRTTKKTAA